MALVDDCIHWNKADNLASLLASEIGPDYLIGGTPTFKACKFADGVIIDNILDDVRFLTTAPFLFAKGMLEMWWDPDSYNIVNGRTSDSQFHMLYEWNLFPGAANTPRMRWYFWRDFTVWEVFWTSGGGGNQQWIVTPAAMDATAGTPVHIVLYWDRTDAAKKRRIYWDGAEIASTNVVWSDENMVGAQFLLGANEAAPGFPNDGIIDNPKWYGDATDAKVAEVIANRFNEGFPTAGGKRMVDGGLRVMTDASAMVA